MSMKRYTKWIVAALGAGLLLAAVPAWADSKKKGNDKEAYALMRGNEAFNNGEVLDARDWYQKEVSENPDNGYAYLFLATAQASNNELGAALSNAEKALKKLPKKDKVYIVAAYQVLGICHLNVNDTVAALKDYESALKADKENLDTYERRGQLYYELEKYDLSDADYRRMMELDRGNTMGYMGVGRNLVARQRWDEAIDMFSQAAKLDPKYSSAYSFRAEAYAGKEDWNRATDDIVEALNIDGDNKAFYLMTRIDKAARPLLKAKLNIKMTKEPSNRYWPYCLGVLAQECEDYEEAVDFYAKANALDANSVFLEKCAQCLNELGRYGEALDFVERGIAMNSEDTDLIELKGTILGNMGRFDEALRQNDTIISIYPENPLNYVARAETHMGAHNWKKAAEDYTTAVVLLPALEDFPYLLLKRGDAYCLAGDAERARADYERLIRVEADSAINESSWTPFAYSGIGENAKAIETMTGIVERDTLDRGGSLYNLACIYARVGEPEKSVETLRRAFEAGYKNTGHHLLDYDLDAVRDMPEFRKLTEDYPAPESVQPRAKNPVESDADGKGSADGVQAAPSAGGNAASCNAEVPFTKGGGVTRVKCTINELPLYFVFDTGASDVTMSMVEANFMLKNDYIKPSDVIGTQRYMDANGDVTEGTVLNLRNVSFGGLELDNVRATVVRNQKAPLLLGQSVLGRLGKIEIDNTNQRIKIGR